MEDANATQDPLFEEPVPRTALDPGLAGEIRRRVFAEPGCVKFTMVRHQGLGPQRESLRPIRLRGEVQWQAERWNGKQVMVRNHAAGPDAEAALDALLNATGAREYHLAATTGDLHVRITRKGRALVSRGKAQPAAPAPEIRGQDREKDQPLSRFDSSALLRVLGIADGNGAVRASMRPKADQINAFLRELDALFDEEPAESGKELGIVDCGCGRAYLTLAAYAYLTRHRGLAVKVRGIDRNAELMAKGTARARALDAQGDVEFIAGDLAEKRELDIRPDLVLSLHACDTATNMAIARGVEWGARHMLIAPCCQHDLQEQIGSTGPMRALLRHGILRERLADLLTDAFRAQLLRILGYRVKIVEFVSPEATPRNLMLRASGGVQRGQAPVVREYLDMRDAWHVVPALEKMVADRIAPYLERQS